MSIHDLINLLQNRINFNQGQRVAAEQRGDVALVQAIDADTMSTQATLEQLLSLGG